jgi:hypothetical protein
MAILGIPENPSLERFEVFAYATVDFTVGNSKALLTDASTMPSTSSSPISTPTSTPTQTPSQDNGQNPSFLSTPAFPIVIALTVLVVVGAIVGIVLRRRRR